MDVVIIADFCGDLDGKDNVRFIYLAEKLSKNHSVELVTSNFNHGAKAHFANISEYPFKVTMLEERGYPKNICLGRFASHYGWGRRVKKYLYKRQKPDVVYCAMPTLYGASAAADHCKKQGVKFIVDVQDLWPEAFAMVLNVPVISKLLFLPFNVIANKAYRLADAVVAVSATYVDRALSVNKKQAKGATVFLGTDLKTFDDGAKAPPVTEKPDGQQWLGYCGSLAASYDIPLVIDALSLMAAPPTLVVMGDGARREEFEAYAKAKNVKAVFTGRLPYGQMCSMLCQCDVAVNPIVKNSAASIINKHADYAAGGIPVVNTQDSPEYRALVDKYQMGFNCQNGNPSDMAERLEKLMGDEDLRRAMGENARRCAVEKFDRENTYKDIIKLITEDC